MKQIPDNTRRQSNLELLRILSMLMIVLSHYTYFGVVRVGQSDAYTVWNSASLFYKGISSISILGTIGVGLFFMISGFFSAHKEKTSIKKVCIITLFYACLTLIITVAVEMAGVTIYNSNGELILVILQILLVPVTGSVWWYVTAYIVLMLIAPSYNRFLEKLNEKGCKIWILFLLVFGYTLGNLGSNFHDLEKALLFYTLGAFFRDYTRRNISSYLIYAIMGVLINGVASYGIFTFALSNSPNAVLFRKAFSMIGYLIAEPLACIGFFGLFLKMNIYSNMINIIAKHMFGIYLVHEAPPMRNLIWIHVLKPWRFYGEGFYFVYTVVCVVGVFLTGYIVDLLREKIIDKPSLYVANRIINSFTNYGFK